MNLKDFENSFLFIEIDSFIMDLRYFITGDL